MYAVYQTHPRASGIPAHPALRERVSAALSHRLEHGLRTHPILTTAAVLSAVGAGMVAAVSALALSVVLPLCAIAALL